MAIKKSNSSIYSIRVLDRVAGILECFRLERPELRLSEIAAATGLHKSTAYRLLDPASRLTRSKLPEFAEEVMRAAENISSRLGYRPKGGRGLADDQPAPTRLVAEGSREGSE